MLLSVGDGEVVVAKQGGAAGYYVADKTGRSYTTRYMHFAQDPGETGTEGETRSDNIALSGNTGRSAGPHHYEVWINQRAVNPLTKTAAYQKELTGSDRRDSWHRPKRLCRSYGLIN